MKKIIFSIFLITIVTAACKKDKPAPTPSTGTEITFKVGFAQNSIGFLGTTELGTIKTNALTSNADTSLTNHVSKIMYMVFDAYGKLVHTIAQNSTDSTFGEYTDNLQAGSYTVAIIAGEKGLSVSGTTLATALLLPSLWFDKEVFFSKFALTVNTAASTKNVSLHRITSYISVNIQDAVPQYANTIKVTVQSVSKKFNIGSETPSDDLALYKWTEKVIPGTTNFSTGRTFMYFKPMNIDITVTGQSPQDNTTAVTYGAKALTGINGKANAVTKLSGKMFGGNTSSGNGFRVQIDTAWKEPITKNF